MSNYVKLVAEIARRTEEITANEYVSYVQEELQKNVLYAQDSLEAMGVKKVAEVGVQEGLLAALGIDSKDIHDYFKTHDDVKILEAMYKLKVDPEDLMFDLYETPFERQALFFRCLYCKERVDADNVALRRHSTAHNCLKYSVAFSMDWSKS